MYLNKTNKNKFQMLMTYSDYEVFLSSKNFVLYKHYWWILIKVYTCHFFRTIFSGLVPVWAAISFFRSPIVSSELDRLRFWISKNTVPIFKNIYIKKLMIKCKVHMHCMCITRLLVFMLLIQWLSTKLTNCQRQLFIYLNLKCSSTFNNQFWR